MGNEIIIVVVCVIVGFIIAVIGLTRGGTEVTHENRAEVALALYKYFKERGT